MNDLVITETELKNTLTEDLHKLLKQYLRMAGHKDCHSSVLDNIKIISSELKVRKTVEGDE